MGKKSVIFISCGIFKEELEYLVNEKKLDWEILFLDAALHVNFDKLKEQLSQALEDTHNKGRDSRVIYGHCHPVIQELLDKYGANKNSAGNCLEAMIGQKEVERINSEAKSFFLSVGWANNWESILFLERKTSAMTLNPCSLITSELWS